MTLYTHPGWLPGTTGCHALIVAAGAYVDAQAPGFAEAVPALPGVAASALELADFLVASANELFRPLATIELLVSQKGGGPVTWQGMAIDPPTMHHIKTVRKSWLSRLAAEPEQMCIAYFSGHGAYQGGLQFLTDDHGPAGVLDECIVRLDAFQTGMSTQCVPYQLFVYDCCQDLPPILQTRLSPVGGTPLVAPDAALVRSDVEQIRIDAVRPGLTALTGNESWLTAALLEALANDGAEPRGNDWWVTPGQLSKVINALGREMFGNQWPLAIVQHGQLKFDRLVKLLQAPEVDVALTTAPPHAVPDAALQIRHYRGNAPINDVNQAPCSWNNHNEAWVRATIQGGMYEASARFAAGSAHKDGDTIFLALPRETVTEIICQ